MQARPCHAMIHREKVHHKLALSILLYIVWIIKPKKVKKRVFSIPSKYQNVGKIETMLYCKPIIKN